MERSALRPGRSAIDYDRKMLFDLMGQAEKSRAEQDYKTAAELFEYAANDYRKVGAEMQKELNDALHLVESLDRKRFVHREWFKRLRPSPVLPSPSDNLTVDRLYQVIDELAVDPNYYKIFEDIREYLRNFCDPMTLRNRARGRWAELFGLAAYQPTPTVAEEVACELILEKIYREGENNQ